MTQAWIAGVCVITALSASAGPAKKAGDGKAEIPAAPSPFERLDLNADGFLTETEFLGGGSTNIATVPPTTLQERRKEFQKMDDDRDRKVSAGEYDAAHAPKPRPEPKAAAKKSGGKGNLQSLRRKAEQMAKRMKQAQGGGK